MATLCITALATGDTKRQKRLMSLTRGLNELNESVSLVLYGDGVYSLVNGSQAAAELAGIPVKIYAVAGDAEERGLSGRLIPQAELIDYPKIVELIMESDRTITGV